jgi:UDP-N-acetyl-D-galactosamine dehydrogenase
MGGYVAEQVIKLMLRHKIQVTGSRVLVLGLAFKENCPDLRNSRVIDVISELRGFNVLVDVCDPWVDPAEAEEEYGISLSAGPEQGAYDAVIVAVAHEQFIKDGASVLREFCKPDGILYDVKSVLPSSDVDGRL